MLDSLSMTAFSNSIVMSPATSRLMISASDWSGLMTLTVIRLPVEIPGLASGPPNTGSCQKLAKEDWKALHFDILTTVHCLSAERSWWLRE